MLRIGTAHDQHLFFILHIKHMLQCADIPEIFFFQSNGFYGDGLSCFDHLLQFFLCSLSDDSSVIHDGDPGTDLLHFFHVMGCVDNGGALVVQRLDPFQDLVSALWVYSYRRLIHNDQSWLVGDPAGNVQSS